METKTSEIADVIYRLSTYVSDIAPPAGLAFNQFLIRAEEPLLFHCGPRAMFPLVSAAASKIVQLEQLRWISFGHNEADECGAMNLWLEAAPKAQVVYSELGCPISVTDLADRLPRTLAPDEILDLGGKRGRIIATPHVPHGWEAQVLFEEVTETLFCGDLFTHLGDGKPLTNEDIVEPAMAAEEMVKATTCLHVIATGNPNTKLDGIAVCHAVQLVTQRQAISTPMIKTFIFDIGYFPAPDTADESALVISSAVAAIIVMIVTIFEATITKVAAPAVNNHYIS